MDLRPVPLNSFLTDLVSISQSTFDTLIKMEEFAEDKNIKQPNGYLSVLDVATGKLLLCQHLGTATVEVKATDVVGPDYLRFLDSNLRLALANAIRLWSAYKQFKTCVTASQCANRDNHEGGGAVASKQVILSVAGLGGEASEALAIGIAVQMNFFAMSKTQALEIARTTHNPLIRPLLIEVL
ncbi:MAG: hypothetical protein WCT08_06555 [Patescibacteria group bacterium]|jgi:hypothetical protein